jgi:hypothetical protein
MRKAGFLQGTKPQPATNILSRIKSVAELLQSLGHIREAGALTDVLTICSHPTDLGGLGLVSATKLSSEQESEILFLVSAWLEALNSADRAKAAPRPLPSRPPERRGMTLSEKIFAMHDVNQKGYVAPGDLIRVDVDWVIASEASWAVRIIPCVYYWCTIKILQGMEATYDQLGKPGIFRNDRFWLAGDHVVDPRVNKLPKVQALIDASERAKKVFKMTDYQGMNVGCSHHQIQTSLI